MYLQTTRIQIATNYPLPCFGGFILNVIHFKKGNKQEAKGPYTGHSDIIINFAVSFFT